MEGPGRGAVRSGDAADRQNGELQANGEAFGPAAPSRVEVLGLDFDVLPPCHLVAAAEALIEAPGTRLVCPVNVDTLNQTQSNPWLRDVIRGADYVYADGVGVVLGAQILGRAALGKRVTAANFIYDMAEAWSDGRYSLYFLGGEDGVAARAAERLRARWPGLRVAGTHHGFMKPAEEEELFCEIDELAPDIVFVGYGVPLEHELTAKYMGQTPRVGVYWMVGALTSYVAGTVPRAPAWMQDIGCEWLFRLGVDPKTKWKRYLFGNVAFLGRVASTVARNELARLSGRTPVSGPSDPDPGAQRGLTKTR